MVESGECVGAAPPAQRRIACLHFDRKFTAYLPGSLDAHPLRDLSIVITLDRRLKVIQGLTLDLLRYNNSLV